MQGLGASGAEWRSTGRPGGADGDEAERALCPVIRNQPTPWAAPTQRGGGGVVIKKIISNRRWLSQAF